MKIQFDKIIVYFLLLAWLVISFCFMLSSCSVTQKQKHHLTKFYKYGGKIDCKSDTVTYRDTTWLDGKPIIKEVKIPCDCADPIIPPTKWEIRHMAKAEKDSMKHVENILKLRNKILEDSLAGALKIKKEDTKQVESDNNTIRKIEKPFPWRLLIVFGIILVLAFVGLFIRYKIPQ